MDGGSKVDLQSLDSSYVYGTEVVDKKDKGYMVRADFDPSYGNHRPMS